MKLLKYIRITGNGSTPGANMKIIGVVLVAIFVSSNNLSN